MLFGCAPKVNLEGKQATDFSLKALDGKLYKLSDLKGKVVLIDFWATWCPPCREELPIIEKLHQEFKDKNLVVLGISNEDRDTIADFLRNNPLTFPILVDEKGNVGKSYKVVAIPRLLLIDKTGKIRKDILGYKPQNEDILREMIEGLLKE
ncbi:TlpA family protein disulfide reductase [bacterium]|nr:TlpA family protein disulfide reductase [bacterium]